MRISRAPIPFNVARVDRSSSDPHPHMGFDPPEVLHKQSFSRTYRNIVLGRYFLSESSNEIRA